MKTRLVSALALISAGVAVAQRVGAPTDDLTNLSVEDLFRLEVTSVDRKAQELSKAPAAIYVLTADDIRRSGAKSVPEALQGIPGLTVQQIDGRMWAISARGFARVYSDKMLVLIDGRSLYTPLFSGVLWDITDVPLENIERIEIMRGPGAVMWGPNAVNGVINIITKKAQDTQGALVSLAGGNDVHGQVFARWGAAPSDRFAYQIWTKLEDRNPADFSAGSFRFEHDRFAAPVPVTDLENQSAQMGFRIDSQLSGKDTLIVEGDFFKMGRQDAVGYPILLPSVMDFETDHSDDTSGYLTARWTRTKSSGNESSLQFNFDRFDLAYPFVNGQGSNLTIDFQKRLQTSDRNEVYWGLGFQHYWDSIHMDWDAPSSHNFVAFDPASNRYYLGDVVLRDEFQLIPNRLLLSTGIRVDYTSYSRFDFQPSIRLLYTPSSRQSVWLAASRAVRVPSRADRDLDSDQGYLMFDNIPMHAYVLGSRSLRPEIVNSLELGYRFQSGQRWSADFASFLTYYKDLAALHMPNAPEVQFVDGIPELRLDFVNQNAASARSYGAELAGTWQLTPQWRLIPAYSYLDESVRMPSNYVFMLNASGYRHQASIRSRFDPSRHWQIDVTARARSRNEVYDLPGAAFLDFRAAWRPGKETEFSFSVQNMANRQVVESLSESPFVSIPTRRTFLVRWTQRF